ncbi:FecR domain-containing protein [Bradyrhizobium sp. CCGUVB4N]|uniref:FecR family protein n=1 Tax=Bradyrhizobium sp. CCGUVB4N TaxID=2949631 RepID=UPI0020B461AC|nr:FecR domain-containing protein [Bradyrhizobium sp. CCGUVB4N]MCP3384423.1 FecR domain-containing protein [Bradyrhizobium sp. CCGUVB4N]
MGTRATIILVAGLVLAQAACAVQAQSDSPRRAVLDSASTPIGKVVAADGSVIIEHAGAAIVQANVAGDAIQTKIGDPVYSGDVVRTGADGRVGINFVDGTSFNLSSNAHMTLDEYVYDPTGKSNSTVFNLTRGTFVFVAGQVAKTGDMKIETPVATMGIRGTTPHVEISDDGTTRFSTLIEEGKNKYTKKSGAAGAPKAEQRVEHRLNLNICRGC